MIKIDYPSHSFRIKNENSNEFIFDEFRKSWLRLTPEEWVRQNFIQYLVQVKKYPSSLIAVEKEIQLGELKKRFDILVYDQIHKPWMMVECKEMNVEIDEKVLQQILRYNIAVPVRYMIITNGSYCVGYEKIENRLEHLKYLPSFI
ncbi:MAG: type I restriction enzyme HsdR N-terminal domain-containing protein [Chitinophagaceae bacterium]|nr:type I restriction enzyme HsdR N-terminal domain-containing protein [Chitinophagaceae bacterium]